MLFIAIIQLYCESLVIDVTVYACCVYGALIVIDNHDTVRNRIPRETCQYTWGLQR